MILVQKQFLNNSEDETGYIIVKASSPKYEDINNYHAAHPELTAEVQIADCSKKIYLDFSCYKDSDVRKRLDKIDVLINNLLDLRHELPKIYDDAVTQAKLWLDNNRDSDKEKEE